MNWYKLQLLLSYHSPTCRVCLQQAIGKPLAYLHGECGRSNCTEKVHLYQLNLEQECVKVKGPDFLRKLYSKECFVRNISCEMHFGFLCITYADIKWQ